MRLITAPYAPEPHPDAAAFGFKTLKFFDDFTSTSTIDLSNSGASGFNWYLRNSWPNSTDQADGWQDFVNGPLTASGDVSVSNSVLTLNQTSGGTGANLQSCVSNGAGHIGTSFSGGLYYQASFAADETLANSANLWPALWMAPLEFLQGTAEDIVEPDVFELFTDKSAITQLHEWTFTGHTLVNDASISGPGTFTFPTHWRDFHTIGLLWVPMAKNGGTGLIRRYFDDVHIAAFDVTYTATAPATPGMTPVNPNGAISVLDAQNLELILSCGENWPLYVDYVAIWQ